ncbi:MAG: DUF4097 domain-containing protein [Lachnospiraceae bacterium]|nr:DUF4097 domain-containing protein [Lachnospiraceae bacterium]
MSKGKIILIAVAAFMFASGVSMLILGINTGAAPVISVGNRKAFANGGKLVNGTVDLSDFDKADIDVASIDTVIEHGDSFRIEYQAYEENIPVAEVNGKTLKLKQPSNGAFLSFDLRRLGGLENEYYRVIVPDSLDTLELKLSASSGKITVDKVNIEGKIDLSSGDIVIDGSKGDNLELEASSGHITLTDTDCKKLKLDVSSGDIKLSGCSVDEIKGEASSGSIRFDGVKTDDVDLDASSGEITLDILGNEDDYSFDIETSSGDIKVGDKKYEDSFKSDDHKPGSIKLSTSSGDVEINFR